MSHAASTDEMTRSPDSPLRRGRPPLGAARAPIDGAWEPHEEGLVEQLLRIVRRRWWIVAQAVVVVVIAALAYSLQQQKEYTASATLLFVNSGQSNDSQQALSTDPMRVAATNGALVRLPEVSTFAARTVSGISAGEIRGSVTVDTGAGDSDVATINAVSADPERAARIANAYASGYIAFRLAAERRTYANSVLQLQRNLEALPLDRQNGEEGDELRRQITALQSAAALRTGGAELVQPASPPSEASSPKTRRNVMLAIVVGLVLGVLLAALLDRLDQRLRTVEDMQRIYELPVLAEVPRIRRGKDGSLSQTDMEPFRMLRANLRFLAANERLRSILFASPVRGDGKSTVARSLAETMAAMGDHVVLVEADLHRQHDGRSSDGLVAALHGAALDEVMRWEEVTTVDGGRRQLAVLPAGPPPPNPSELVDSPRMRELIEQLEDSYELVIVDGPATGSVSDSLSLMPLVSGVLVVAGLGRTTTKAATFMRRQLELLDERAIGLAVNFAKAPANGYGYRG